MNRQMWANPATRRNVAQLVADGVAVLGPGVGDQACGETGEGRMLEPEEILAALVAWAQPKVLAGKRVLLTAGPTFEAIDPVRGITNTSSGKMGFALAQAAAEAGAEVTLVSGPSALPTPANVARVDVRSAAEMAAAVMARVGALRHVHRGGRGRRLHAGRDRPSASARRTASRSRSRCSRPSTFWQLSRRGPIRRSASASPPRATMSSGLARRSGGGRSCRC